MFVSLAKHFDYLRAPPGRRRECQSASVSVEKDLAESGTLADTSVLHNQRLSVREAFSWLLPDAIWFHEPLCNLLTKV